MTLRPLRTNRLHDNTDQSVAVMARLPIRWSPDLIGQLSTSRRRGRSAGTIGSSSSGGSQGRYPIDTKKRARAALRYSARADTAGTYRTVSNKVHKRYPSLSRS